MQRDMVAKLIEMDPEWKKESTAQPKVGLSSNWSINVYGE
jgi:homoserine O-acetyltransferase